MPRNAQTTAVFTISLPTAIAQKIERTRKEQHRSRSELARDAFRVYFRAQELAEDEGRRAYLDAKAGKGLSPIYDTADEFIDALHKATRRPAGARRSRKK
ncbi:MAG: ribbon-helix-helix protein, CopG family [Candidatus Binatia bacterium]